MAIDVQGQRGREFDRGYQDGWRNMGRIYLADRELDEIYEMGYVAGGRDSDEPIIECPECHGDGAPHDGGPCPHCIAIRKVGA